jgi:hypothetical protein
MDSFDDWTNLLEQTEIKLKRLLGLPEFKVKAYDGEEVVGIDGYFHKGYPSCALEVIEQFYEELAVFEESGEEKALRFQTEINEAMTTFQCPWLLSKGRFFQIDAVFFNEEIIQKSEDILSEQGLKEPTMSLGKLGKTSLMAKLKMLFLRHSKASRVH